MNGWSYACLKASGEQKLSFLSFYPPWKSKTGPRKEQLEILHVNKIVEVH